MDKDTRKKLEMEQYRYALEQGMKRQQQLPARVDKDRFQNPREAKMLSSRIEGEVSSW